MENMTVSRAAALCSGKLFGQGNQEAMIGQIVVDSRAVQPGDLFAAFKGEYTDGHNYINTAIAKGAACCIGERVPENLNGMMILVPDVLKALEQITAAYRQDFDIPVIGITGSVGKTTAKEMISSVLGQHYHVLKTEGNLNNRIGIPMMLSRLNSTHELAVIEMGISEFGEMRHLAEMVRPTMAVYTVIGHAHLEYLHDLDGVLRAKSEMLEYLPEKAVVLVNGDDEKLRSMTCSYRKISCGLSADLDVCVENARSDGIKTACELVFEDRRISVEIPAFGQHYLTAAALAAGAGMVFRLNDEEIQSGIAHFRNVERRGDVLTNDYLTLIDDSYNANPDSVRSSIDSLAQFSGRHVCILGDMLELGEGSADLHREVGRYAAEKGIELLMSSGRYARDFCNGFGSGARYYESREKLIEALPRILHRGDIILVKASKGSHYEHVAAAVKKVRNDPRPVVLLDLDDTILDFKKAERIALCRSLEESGIQENEELLDRYSVVNLEHWERLERGEILRDKVLIGRFEQLFREFDISADPCTVQERYEHNLSIGHYFVDGAQEMLETLSRDYRLFLVSNGTAVVQEGRLQSAGISHYFEKIFISELIGVDKPDKEYFERCFAEIPDFDREHCLIVGDSLTSDILGGIRAGIRTCWFNLRGREDRTDIVPDCRISSLKELPGLLIQIFPDG